MKGACRPLRRTVLRIWLPAAFATLGLVGAAQAQFEDDGIEPGLIGEYAPSSGPPFTRIDRVVMQAWEAWTPADRAGNSGLRIRWHGYLLSQATGEYQLHAYAAGRLRVTLGGATVLEADVREPTWTASQPVKLAFDLHPLEITYEQTLSAPLVKLFWSGPQFQLEPLSQRYLFHDAADAAVAPFERGGMLVSAFRCAACHEIPGEAEPIPAPALDALPGHLHFDWVVSWLTAQPTSGEAPRRMPYFGLNRDEAEAIAAYLFARASSAKPRPASNQKKIDRQAGEHLLLTLGCLACHRVGALGNSDLFGGGDLSQIAAKRPAGFFERWLEAPETINRDHRMPLFELSGEQRRNLAEHLASLGKPPARQSAPAATSEQLRRGEELVQKYRCAACHRLGTPSERVACPPIRLDDPFQSCLAEPLVGRFTPGYRLSPADRVAVEYFLSTGGSGQPLRRERLAGERLLAEHNCLACHQRDDSPGLAPQLPAIADAEPELAPLVPAMTPPALISVGDKLQDQAIRDALLRKSVRRDYLLVQMPRFRLNDDELQALVSYFVQADRIPPREEQGTPAATDPKLLHAVGSRLVTASGFGCTSCHALGQAQPSKAPINARGPSLTMLGERVRREWFDRFLKNPLRVVPRMEMPSIQVAVRGVLNDDLPAQLNAVWDVLNTQGFEPPLPDPVRIVRHSGLRESNERAVALTDVLRRGRDVCVKPLLIGLPNRHSVCFNLEHAAVERWSLGDVAQQRTEGKTWFWEAGGNVLLDTELQTPEVALIIPSGELVPQLSGQFVTDIDELSHVDGGIRFRHRLHLAGGVILRVSQQVRAIWPEGDGASGVERQVEIDGVPTGAAVRLLLAASSSEHVQRGADRRRLTTRFGTIELVEPEEATIGEDFSVVARPRGSTPPRFVIRYLTELPIDQFPVAPPTPPVPQATVLHVVPGCEVVRLPLPDEFMPTALAWNPAGDLFVGSLKGRVWRVRDADGDGLPEEARPVSDELAAPYGLAAAGDHLDVLTKYGLLRLSEPAADGHFQRLQTLASGWGHTADYHDWAVGLPQDEEGNYYVALPCQQDDRSPAAAHLRGTFVKLVPREPTPNDPRRFSLQPLTQGHRFPMGVARNRQGEIFVTDNQGHYNPFNELNHIIPGRHYGFINRLERGSGARPKLTPPAIDIPHPWTRSVNGICFLETPPSLRASHGDVFGPFEGHLLGCEYDTRRLVRMSLQRVGQTYQGAAYPFSYDAPAAGPPLLGPVTCAVSPAGDIFVGGLRDSGWGGANNVGEIVRLRLRADQLPCGIAEVRAVPEGFVIEFTQPVDRSRADDLGNYSLASYTRVSTPAYGGPDEDRRQERLTGVEVSDDARQVRLRLPELRSGYVYEFRLRELTPGGAEFFPAEAHYTLRETPR